jgi:4-hydroxy-tetrahydrodipicolinate reductase
MSSLRVAIHGAAGRMGQRLIALGSADPDLQITAALEHTGHPDLGRDAGEIAAVRRLGIPLSPTITSEVDAVIDFSIPEAAIRITDTCATKKIPLVIATTGLNKEQAQRIREASSTIPVVWAPSMSLAVNLTMKLAEIAAGALKDCPNGADVEIIERHHRFKEDAPSGTALRFGEIIASAMGLTSHRHGREGQTGKRTRKEIGYHAVRVGDNPGEHNIVFGMLGETIELTVKASNRDCYAAGALQAAKFVAKQSPGLYNMYDVLGLSQGASS